MERVPVEIWRKILDLTMKTWLLPGSDDNLIDDIFLFNFDCESTMEYRQFETIRRQLRLVCRNWKQVADEHDVGFTISVFQGNTLPSEAAIGWAKRVQVPSNWRCSCTQCPNSSRTISSNSPATKYYMPIVDIHGDTGINSSFMPDSAQVLVLSPLRRDILSYLKRAPYLLSLRAISCHAYGFWDGANTQVQALFENLTRLHLRERYSTRMGITLCLQRLKYLRFDSSIGHWAFPQLTTFFVSGRAFVDDNKKLRHFLHNHALTLRNIIFDYGVVEKGEQKLQAPDLPPFQEYPVLEIISTDLLAPHCILDRVSEDNRNGAGPFSLLLTNISSLIRLPLSDPTSVAHLFHYLFNSSKHLLDSASIPYS